MSPPLNPMCRVVCCGTEGSSAKGRSAAPITNRRQPDEAISIRGGRPVPVSCKEVDVTDWIPDQPAAALPNAGAFILLTPLARGAKSAALFKSARVVAYYPAMRIHRLFMPSQSKSDVNILLTQSSRINSQQESRAIDLPLGDKI